MGFFFGEKIRAKVGDKYREYGFHKCKKNVHYFIAIRKLILLCRLL